MQAYIKITLAAILMVVAGCARTQSQQNASGPREWPSYWALDDQKRGHPALTSSQEALIRKTLALTTLCQAAQLRYAFPRNAEFRNEAGTMVLFFETGGAGGAFHVLWTYNLFYNAIMGESHAAPGPGPKGVGTAYEVQHESCQ